MRWTTVLGLVGVAILVLVLNVLCSILYMIVYGHLINPGHEAKYYEDHIQVAGPYCSIVAGIPIMFFAGWWVAGWKAKTNGVRSALVVWSVYTLIDLSILIVAGLSLGIGALFVVSFGTKLVAVYLGARRRLSVATTDVS